MDTYTGSPSYPFPANNLQSGVTYYWQVQQRSQLYGEWSQQCQFTTGPGGGQTLSVSLNASPSSGLAPLSPQFTAAVGGSATGTINYTFWWDCADPGTDVGQVEGVCGTLSAPATGSCTTDNAIGVKCDGVTDNPKIISHTYPSAGAHTAKVIAEQGSAPPAEARAPISVTSSSPSSVTITTSSLPQGQVGVLYSANLSAIGGTPPYGWTPAGGTLPPGIYVSSEGPVSGTPTMLGTFNFTVEAFDSSVPPQTTEAPFSITIQPNSGLAITTLSLADGQVNVAYDAPLAAIGGSPPYMWSLLGGGGNAPPGIGINDTGVNGTPTSAGTYEFTAFVQDSVGHVAQQQLSMNVSPAALAVTTPSLPNAQVGAAYSSALQASGGTPPYTWSLSVGQGTFPPGLGLDSYGNVAGTPSNSGAFTFTVQVQDSAGQVAQKQLSITAEPSTAFVGQVLVAGGSSGGSVLNSAEIYDPNTGQFLATSGPMVSGRTFHTATDLLDSRVLITGGVDQGGNTLASTEVYDPVTRTFTPASNMNDPRKGHTATLFTSGPLAGQVLIVGGLDASGNYLASADLYDPNSNAFTATNRSLFVHAFHTATLLPNGQVLIAGGGGVTAEVYDPAQEQFLFDGLPEHGPLAPHGDAVAEWQGSDRGRDRCEQSVFAHGGTIRSKHWSIRLHRRAHARRWVQC